MASKTDRLEPGPPSGGRMPPVDPAGAGTPAPAHRRNPLICGLPLTELVSLDEANAGPRSKRAMIIDEAVRRFGETGYEHTKWSSIANDVGIGQTALYHYFESKAHCLLSIMRMELARSYQRFLEVLDTRETSEQKLAEALRTTFDVSNSEILQLRIVLANTDVLTNPRPTEREETERQYCIELTKSIESAWTELIRDLLARPGRSDEDPKMVARAVLGLINGAWRWYRANGRLSVSEVGEFYTGAAQRIVL